MLCESESYRAFDLLKVNEKFLALAFQFAARNGTHKWVIERDWKDIEVVLTKYISEEKYLNKIHVETLNVTGDIQLEITTKECPSYFAKLFNLNRQVLHGNFLAIKVNYGKLQANYAVQTGTNGSSTSLPVATVSVFDSEEGKYDKYVPKSKAAKSVDATYTPSKTIKTVVEEYIPGEISPETANQYKATKRKAEKKDIIVESETSPNIFPSSSESSRANTPIRLMPVQTPPKKWDEWTTQDMLKSLGTWFEDEEEVLPQQQLPEDAKPQRSVCVNLFGSDDTDSDVEVIEPKIEETEGTEKRKNARKKKLKTVSIENWLMKGNVAPALPTTSRAKRDLRIIKSPARAIMKKKMTKKTEKTQKFVKSPCQMSCAHIDTGKLLQSYERFEGEMDKTMKGFLKTGRVPKITDIEFTRYTDLINGDQIQILMDFLSTKYELTNVGGDYGRLIRIISDYILPEWTFRFTMITHNVTRSQLIDYFNKKDRRDAKAWTATTQI
ncbi:uncharacterized protein LOC132257215 [Phlebotomus argentipes]|uniref:uncharacterized protein LOC132257215 n=1 Tax=Phlebotomus argentipes TaxID=94469 RepID=UPI002892D56E|nr:uncharacterized protein LOC132257215 [Phlebotomus argentipes]